MGTRAVTFRRALLPCLAFATLVVLFVAVSPAADRHEGPRVPAQTSEGRFEGTWVRIEPGERHGIQLRRGEEGRWQVRLYWYVANEIEIDTQWKSRHDYAYQEFPGFIELSVDEERSTPDKLVVNYRREADGRRGAHMVETGDITLTRGGTDGRTLAWVQDPLVRVIDVADALYPDEQRQRTETRKVWLFHKQSERDIPWDEVYW